MGKSAFAFKLGQRLNVPNRNRVQGVVTLPRYPHSIPLLTPAETHIYYLAWLADDGSGEDGWFSEGEILEANCEPEPISVEALTAAVTDNPERKSQSDRSVKGTQRRLRHQSRRNKNRSKRK